MLHPHSQSSGWTILVGYIDWAYFNSGSSVSAILFYQLHLGHWTPSNVLVIVVCLFSENIIYKSLVLPEILVDEQETDLGLLYLSCRSERIKQFLRLLESG